MLQKLSQAISFLAGIAYIVMGGLVIYNYSFIIKLKPIVAYSLGIVLILYGFFRVVRGVYSILDKNK